MGVLREDGRHDSAFRSSGCWSMVLEHFEVMDCYVSHTTAVVCMRDVAAPLAVVNANRNR